MISPATIDEVFDLYETQGAMAYGELISQNDHALQCVALARADGVNGALVVAALSHDVGHKQLHRVAGTGHTHAAGDTNEVHHVRSAGQCKQRVHRAQHVRADGDNSLSI